MSNALKIFLISGLFMFAFQSIYANDSALQDSGEQNISQEQYILPPPSPFFSSRIVYTKLDSDADASQLASLETSGGRVQELESALKETQTQSSILLDELHAAAKNSDFENEMYEKTVSQLQAKITELSEKSKKLSTKLADLEQAGEDSGTVAKIKTLEDAYTAKSEEVEILKIKLSEFETASKEHDELLKTQITQNATLKEKISSEEQTQAELTDLQNEATEMSDNNQLLKTKIVELEDNNKSLKTQLSALKEESSKQTQKLGLMGQSTAELEATKSAYKELNDEVVIVKSKLQEEQEVSKSLNATIESLKAESNQNIEKLGLLEKSASELDSLKNDYQIQGDQLVVLQSKLTGAEVDSQLLQVEIDSLNAESSKNTEKLGLLAQSSVELEALQAASKEQTEKANELKSTNTELNDQVVILKSKLQEEQEISKSLNATVEMLKAESSQNLDKLGLLEQSTTELNSLKNTYKSQGDELIVLQSKLKGAEVDNQLLLATVETLKAESNKNADKLGVMGQSIADLETLQSEFETQKGETVALKAKLSGLDDLNKTLLSQVKQFEIDASQSKRTLGLLDQTSAELTSLKSAYKERNDESTALKEKVLNLDDTNKKLQAEIEALKADATQQTQKLGLLDQSTAELSTLKDKLKELSDQNITLKSQLATATDTNTQQVRKLASLNKETAKLAGLKSAYKERNDENVELKKQVSTIAGIQSELEALKTENSELTLKLNEQKTLKNTLDSSASALANLQKLFDESEDKSKTLNSKLKTYETDVSNQKRQIGALSEAADELAALKSAYKDLKQQNVDMNDEFIEAMKDPDQDGVVNKIDQCKSSPLGSSVDSKGCPDIADSDGDKVADANDLCPATAAGKEVNQFGCLPNQNINLKGVNFTLGSDKLTSSSLPIIKAAAATLTKSPNIKVEVAGYTDNLGVKSTNQRLSRRRANSVAIELIKQGVEASRISIKGYGDSNPIASNTTEAGRLSNRRVELKIR